MIYVDTSAILDVASAKLLKRLDNLVIGDRVIQEVERQLYRGDKYDKAKAAMKLLKRLDYKLINLDTTVSVDQALLRVSSGETLFTLDVEMGFLHKGNLISWPQLSDVFPFEAGETVEVENCHQDRPNQMMCKTVNFGYPVLIRHYNQKIPMKMNVRVGQIILKKTGALLIAKKI